MWSKSTSFTPHNGEQNYLLVQAVKEKLGYKIVIDLEITERKLLVNNLIIECEQGWRKEDKKLEGY